MAESYRGGLEPWKQLYAEFLKSRGLQLRPGLTVDDLASLLSAMAEGVLTRAMGDPASNVIDHSKQRSTAGNGSARGDVCVPRVHRRRHWPHA